VAAGDFGWELDGFGEPPQDASAKAVTVTTKPSRREIM